MTIGLLNPGATIGILGEEIYIADANRIFQGITISQTAWTYNASSDTYERG
jgi:hypothetical protein